MHAVPSLPHGPALVRTTGVCHVALSGTDTLILHKADSCPLILLTRSRVRGLAIGTRQIEPCTMFQMTREYMCD